MIRFRLALQRIGDRCKRPRPQNRIAGRVGVGRAATGSGAGFAIFEAISARNAALLTGARFDSELVAGA
jgi:hypothetical protein